MPIELLHHFTIRCRDMARTKDFYRDVLGFEAGARPAFPFAGYWLYCGDQPAVHLVEHDDPTAIGSVVGLIGKELAMQPVGERTGAVDHIAFSGTNRKEVSDRLDRLGIAYTYNPVPGGQLHQLFVRDPDGVILELNFPA